MNINVDRIGICEALIDTGADLSVVDLSTALNTGLEIINPDKMCSGPDGKELDIVGNIILNIKFDDKTITHQFVIMRTHLRIFILGRDFLKKMNAKIDCQREIIKYDLTENRDVIKYQQKKIKSAKDAIIPELSIKLINAFVEAEDGEYIIEENHKMFQTNGLRLARSLINVVNKETYIWITNPYPRPLKILKNQTLCFGSQPAEVNLIEESEQKEHEEPQFQINENLAYTEKEQLKQVLERYEDLFSSGLGRSNLAKHRIDTEGAKPIKHKPYRVSAKEREIIKEQIDEMLRDGIIRPSSSPWSFPVILVKKRDGKYRFCVDYRKLNDVTVKDVYPIPRIDEVLDTLQGSKYFSAIDLKSGYWQVEVEEKDKEKTAFTTAHGLYEFNVMPFGLCNAPATFERNMENMLGNLRWQICLCYLDDVIIYSSDFSTHLKRIEAVLKCFREANLKLNNKKCQFAFEELEILGHITNQHGIKPAEHNIKAIRDFPRPKRIKEVQSFLGMCSYYRKFIKGFSKIADPLTSLIKKNVPFTWTENQEKAFQTLKVALINPPILGHFDPNAITYIHTDASNIGLGATLVQKFGDKEKVISYLSRTLSKPEQNYSTTEKECLAVVWSMSKLRPYLYGRHFKIVTDHHALCWLKNLKDPTGRLARWALKIQEYNFEIIHKSGKKHLDADANYPFERIGIDFVGPLPSTKRRRKWIIVLTDYYTKYAETKAVSEATVKEVSTFLIEHIILRHGAPRFLISDRGSQFTSNLMKEVMKMCKVKHCFTTSYHPQTNGLTERLNRTLINMISIPKELDEILPFITHEYNTTIQETTGYSPFFLLFGREPMSLLDDENIPTDSNMDDYDEYIENYLDKIARTRQVVINNTEKTQERMKRNYDKKHNEKIYEPGHLVAVWTPVRKIGKCEKLLRKYFGPYRILKKLSNVNYLIEPKDNPGQDPLIVHVSRLKPYFERIDEVEDLKKKGLVRGSRSPWAFPVTLVPKADGQKRLCLDYCRLNALTIDDKMPLPNIQEVIDRLQEAKYFTSLDIASGYWYVEMAPDSTMKTAFNTNEELYEWLVMPFGLKNAPATFQRIIQQTLEVLEKLYSQNLKFKLQKCYFIREEIEYLGYIIKYNQVTPSPRKIEAVKSFPIPKTVIIDHHSRYIWASPTASNNSAAILNILRQLLYSGVPIKRILKDNWSNFQSRSFKNFMSENKIVHSFATPYPPQTCGMVEKANHTLLTRLRAVILEKPKQKWSTPVPFIVKTYNQTPHEVSKFSPKFLLYGIYESPSSADHPITLEEARGLARENTRKAQIKRKNLHDDEHPDVEFPEGDQVFRTVAKHHP
ncbi:K02A2.6-like [Cordylochernes scorpioides]|uniref:RNA-directed DNA polymerase n=1 Tax=Cordylochernes scorpioides TaxID=51811 RepID=A0ABY6KBS0_9ARAC|nr:K02A2.6-like [Cordylochernes scorpioides]